MNGVNVLVCDMFMYRYDRTMLLIRFTLYKQYILVIWSVLVQSTIPFFRVTLLFKLIAILVIFVNYSQ